MDEMASSFFVIIFERLFGHALTGAIKPPHLKLKSQRINNLRLAIKQLSEVTDQSEDMPLFSLAFGPMLSLCDSRYWTTWTPSWPRVARTRWKADW